MLFPIFLFIFICVFFGMKSHLEFGDREIVQGLPGKRSLGAYFAHFLVAELTIGDRVYKFSFFSCL